MKNADMNTENTDLKAKITAIFQEKVKELELAKRAVFLIPLI